MGLKEEQYHISTPNIARYFLGELSDEKANEIENHFDDCSSCIVKLGLYRVAFYDRELEKNKNLSESLDLLWKSWSAEKHGKVYLGKEVANTIVYLSSSDEKIKHHGSVELDEIVDRISRENLPHLEYLIVSNTENLEEHLRKEIRELFSKKLERYKE